VLIEAINTIDNGPVLISTTAEADALRTRVDRPNVRLQYDAYHIAAHGGRPRRDDRAHLPAIAHVQIADSPGRNQPGTGEIAYPFVLGRIEALGYRATSGSSTRRLAPIRSRAWTGCRERRGPRAWRLAEAVVTRLGFVGLGVMGRPMAGHLLAAGHAVTVFARTPGIGRGPRRPRASRATARARPQRGATSSSRWCPTRRPYAR